MVNICKMGMGTQQSEFARSNCIHTKCSIVHTSTFVQKWLLKNCQRNLSMQFWGGVGQGMGSHRSPMECQFILREEQDQVQQCFLEVYVGQGGSLQWNDIPILEKQPYAQKYAAQGCEPLGLSTSQAMYYPADKVGCPNKIN